MAVFDEEKTKKLKSIFESMEYSKTSDNDNLLKEWIKQRNGELGTYLSHEYVKFGPDAEDTVDFCNPTTGDKIADLTVFRGNDTFNLPIASTNFSSLTGYERSKIIYNIARNVQKSQRLLALAESVPSGRHISATTNTNLPDLIRCLYHSAGVANLVNDTLVGERPPTQIIVATESPSPIFSQCWSIFPLMAMGTNIIFVTTVETCLSTLVFVDICKTAGLPKEAISVIVTSKSSVDEALREIKITNANVLCQTDAVTLNLIQQAVIKNGHSLVSHKHTRPTVIVTESSDLVSAVDGCLIASYAGIGTRHGCRILVQESIFDKFEKEITMRFKSLRIGLWNDKNADFSSCITKSEDVDELLSVVREAEKEGAKVITLERTSPVYLISGVQPASAVVQKQTKGVVIILLPFRSAKEAVALANSSPGTLVASVWSERLTVAIEIAKSIQAKMVWINTQNHYDRPNDKNLWRIVVKQKSLTKGSETTQVNKTVTPAEIQSGIDETYKLYYGGGQKRALSSASYGIHDFKGNLITLAPKGGKKDARNAVEAAVSAHSSWRQKTGYNKAQLLYYLAENLQKRREEFSSLLTKMTGQSKEMANKEIDDSIRDVFKWAGFCDKSSGSLLDVPLTGFCLSSAESLGVVAVVINGEENVFRSFIIPAVAAISCGNTVVAVAPQKYPLAALSLYQVLDTSDFPPGVFNIICGDSVELGNTLFEHFDVQAFWSDNALSVTLAKANIVNSNGKEIQILSQTLTIDSYQYIATALKQIWLPSGDSFGN